MAGPANPPANPPADPPADPPDDDAAAKAQFTEWFGQAMDGWLAAREADPKRTKPRRDLVKVLLGG